MRDERRIGDPFRQPRISDAILPRCLCDHVQVGALIVARLQRRGAMVSLCADCYEQRDQLRITVDGKVVTVLQ
jgi:hypothetical protein